MKRRLKANDDQASFALSPAALPDEKLLEIHRRLCLIFGCPITYFRALDPLSELVSSLLSHRTRNAADRKSVV